VWVVIIDEKIVWSERRALFSLIILFSYKTNTHFLFTILVEWYLIYTGLADNVRVAVDLKQSRLLCPP